MLCYKEKQIIFCAGVVGHAIKEDSQLLLMFYFLNCAVIEVGFFFKLYTLNILFISTITEMKSKRKKYVSIAAFGFLVMSF